MTSPMARAAAALTAALALTTTAPALAQLTQVGSVGGFLNAVAQGATFVEITNHLDLTNQAGMLPLLPAPTTLAILGNCLSPAPTVEGGPPLGDVPLGTCVIQTPTTLFQWPLASFGARQVWVNKLHIRLSRGDSTAPVDGLIDWDPASPRISLLWLTNSTLQGDGNPDSNGLSLAGADSLVEGATFSFHNGFAISVTGVEANFAGLTLLNNTAPTNDTGIIQAQMDGRVRLEGVVRANNTGFDILTADDGTEAEAFDEGFELLNLDEFTRQSTRGLSSSGSRFTLPGDPRIVSIEQSVAASAPSVSDEPAMAPGMAPTAAAPSGATAATAPAATATEEETTDGADAAGATMDQDAMAPVAAQDNGAGSAAFTAAVALATCAAAVAV